MTTLYAWQFNDITTTGPDPFPASNSHNGDAVGASTITIGTGATTIETVMSDNDSDFNNNDAGQKLDQDVTFDGVGYSAGDNIVVDYAYILRPQGSSDPADNVTIYVLKIGGVAGDHVGIVSDAHLAKGVTYDVVDLPSFPDSPTVAYSSVYVCFAKGTRIGTPRGPCAVEALRVGDTVCLKDGGALPLRWIGRRRVRLDRGFARRVPVRIASGSLGPGQPCRDLVVSPQHRLWWETDSGPPVLVPAIALTCLPGIRPMRGLRAITYYSLLLPRHAVIGAEGAWAESFYPGCQGLAMLPPLQRVALAQMYPGLTHDPVAAYGGPALPMPARPEAEALVRSQRKEKRDASLRPACIDTR